MSVFVVWLPVSTSGQESPSNPDAKGPPAQEKHTGLGRWSGIVTGTDKNQSTLTVRRRDGFERVIHYDSATRSTSQEHHSEKMNTIDASQVHDSDRVICIGFYDENGRFQAAMISKRLSK